jgi:hypothetical protein
MVHAQFMKFQFYWKKWIGSCLGYYVQGWPKTRVKLVLPSPVGKTWLNRALPVKSGLNRAKPRQSTYIMVKVVDPSRTVAEDSDCCRTV